RYATALRVAAVALLPVGLAMTGVVRFVVNMTVNPVAWAGFGVLTFAVLLLLVARLVEGRGRGRQAAAGGEGASGPAALPRTSSRGSGKPAAGGGDDLSDFSEIE